MPDPSAADPNQSPSPDPSQSLAAPPDTCPSITPRGLLGECSQGGGQGGAKEWSTGSPDLGGHHCGRDPNTCRKPLPNAVPRKQISLKGPSRHTHESCAQGPRRPAARHLKVTSSIDHFQGDKSSLSSSRVLTYDQLWSPHTDIFGNLCTLSVSAVIHDDQALQLRTRILPTRSIPLTLQHHLGSKALCLARRRKKVKFGR